MEKNILKIAFKHNQSELSNWEVVFGIICQTIVVEKF